ncbi:substrate-binding domain-containing protein [Actinomadura madurae]|nr:substrate-binding domain-containing protein [Actinomadura madurae]
MAGDHRVPARRPRRGRAARRRPPRPGRPARPGGGPAPPWCSPGAPSTRWRCPTSTSTTAAARTPRSGTCWRPGAAASARSPAPPTWAPPSTGSPGYRLAAREAGICVNGLVCQGDFGRLSGERAMRRLLERRPDVDAVLAASDQMAVGALGALRRAGRRVPDDVAVVGFDDAPVARQVRPRLTTVRQPGGGPRRPAGARAARLHRRPPEHRARRRAAHQVDHPGVRLTAPG